MPVPKLRFKEFTDEWEKLNAEDIFKNISNKNHNGDLPILAVTQDKGVVYRDSLDLTINSSEKGIKNYKIIEPGDFVISLRSFQGGIEYSNLLGISSPAYTVLKSKIRISDSFYKFYLKKESFISELNSTIEGIRDGKQISYSMFSKLKLPYTTFEEQKKIGNFLSSIDKKISITEEKLNLFEEYKKGIMQKIFNQELRFKNENENDYPEWEEKYLGEIGEIITGKTPSTKDEKNWNGSIQFVTPTDINDNKYQKYTQRKVSENIKMKILPIGTIMFTCIASIGKMSISTEKCITNQQINSIIVNEDIYNEYIYYALLNLVPKIKASQSTTTLPIINKTEFSKFMINLPCLEEQKKIVDFLSAIDSKIEKLSDELENLKEFKKGLLQQMFV